jgi:elongation factor G
MAGSMALQEAVKRGKPIILEPIMKVEIIVPDQFLGATTGDLASRRGQIMSVDDRGTLGLKVISAHVPLSEMFGYATSIRSLSEGRGTFNMEFAHYDPVPASIAQQISEGKK